MDASGAGVGAGEMSMEVWEVLDGMPRNVKSGENVNVEC